MPLSLQVVGTSTEEAKLAADARGHTWTVPLPARPVIAWDERMEAHEETRPGSPHPERPDRVKAVIARVIACGAAENCDHINVREATRQGVLPPPPPPPPPLFLRNEKNCAVLCRPS